MTRLLLGSLVCTALTVAGQASAQTNDEVFPSLQWNFGTPGARANAMGQAFIGVADDATASTTNPAGLTRLTRPQFHAEYQRRTLQAARLVQPDALFTASSTVATRSVGFPSFASLSFPLGTRAAISASRHQFLRHSESFRKAPQALPPAATFLLFPVAAEADFSGVAYVGSVAVSLNDRFSIGTSVSVQQFDAHAVATRHNFLVGPTFPSDLRDVVESPIVVNQSSIEEDAVAVGVTVGGLFSLHRNVTLGLTYVHAPPFSVTETLKNNPGEQPDFKPGPCCGTNLPLVDALGSPFSVTIDTPDRLGVGVSVRPLPRLLVAIDALRIRYSDLTRELTLIFDRTTLDGRDFSAPDVTEVHIGAEWSLIASTPGILVRAGVFTNPAHRTRYQGSHDVTTDAEQTAIYNVLPQRSELNLTLGVGIVVGARLQLDGAYIHTVVPSALRRTKDLMLSAAVRF